MNMKIKLFLTLAIVFICSGCSTMTVQEFDPATGVKTKETITKNTLAATIVTSTKDKSIFMWSSGWMAWVECSPATPENPTPHVILLGGQIDKGMILLHKDQKSIDGIAAVVLATRSNITITPTGATSSTPK